MTRRAVGRIVLSVLLVLASVAGASGNAAAEITLSTDCDAQDLALGWLSTVANPEDSCGIYDDRSGVDETDAYASALAMADAREAYLTSRSNLQEDVRGIIWMEGKAAAIEALNDGQNESQAQAAFDAAVDNYTARLVENDLRRLSAEATQLSYLSAQTGGGNTSSGSNVDAYASTYTITYKLPDGRKVDIQQPTYTDSFQDRTPAGLFFHSDSTLLGRACCEGWEPGHLTKTNEHWDHGGMNRVTVPYLLVAPPDGPTTPLSYTDEGEQGTVAAWHIADATEQIAAYLEAGDQIKANGDEWVTGVYSQYAAGEITAAELWDPITLAQEASTEYNSTGYYGFANAELNAIGLTGDVNTSHVVETTLVERAYVNGSRVTTNYSATIDGTLFIAGSNSMSLDTGTTYDPANLDGTVYMTVADARETTTGEPINGTGTTVELTEPFTIIEATDTRTGAVVNTTAADNQDYTTANATRLQEQIDELRQLREYYENKQANPSDVSVSEPTLTGSLFPTGNEVPVFVAAFLLVGFVMIQLFKP